MTTSLAHFRAAAEAHLHVASASVAGTVPGGTPASIAYLCSVALECSLKALILRRFAAVDIAGLKSKQPKIYKHLFSMKSGHKLDQLAAEAGLRRHLSGDAPEVKAPLVWKRMCAQDRPYSLRYGFEPLKGSEAVAERNEALRLHGEVRSLLGRRHR